MKDLEAYTKGTLGMELSLTLSKPLKADVGTYILRTYRYKNNTYVRMQDKDLNTIKARSILIDYICQEEQLSREQFKFKFSPTVSNQVLANRIRSGIECQKKKE